MTIQDNALGYNDLREIEREESRRYDRFMTLLVVVEVAAAVALIGAIIYTTGPDLWRVLFG